MKRSLCLSLALLASGCGGAEEAPSADSTQSGATAPITVRHDRAEVTVSGDVSEAVSSSTMMQPARPPAAVPVRSAEDSYRAMGTEPFWAVIVKRTNATLERPDKAAVRYSVVREDDGRAIRYLGAGFSMTITQGPCSDGMSDAIWSDRVQVAFGEGTLKGCGGAREDQGAEAP